MATPINEWIEAERPREKMILKGTASLTDSELIAILLRSGLSGDKPLTAIELGREILRSTQNNLLTLSRQTIEQLTQITGVGIAKAASIVSAFELGRRVAAIPDIVQAQISSAEMVFKIMGPFLSNLDHEECWIIYLNMNNKIIGKELASHGGVNSTIMDIKLISKRAIEMLASKIIMIHNHPSGSVQPSEADIKQTVALRDAIKLFDIELVDHIIIAGKRYFSFFDNNC